ncbi:MAG: pyridoxal phosphate-dependent aminotransferase [Bacteroidota bacterium]
MRGKLRQLSGRVAAMEESQTMAFTARALQLREEGVDVITMTAGEPDFPTADHVKAAAKEALDANFTHYTAVQGHPEILQAVVEKFRTVNGLLFNQQQVMVTTGAKQALTNALLAICEDGDEVVIPSPCWVSYPSLVRLSGGIPVSVPSPLASGFRPNLSGMRKAITRKTKAIVLNSPNNPTGVVYTREELEGIVALAVEHQLYIISDEIYEEMLFDGRKHTSIGILPGAEDRTITVNGFSKTYAMTGWRIGYMGGPEEVIHTAMKIQGQMTSSVNSISQKAGVAALRGTQAPVHKMVKEFQRRRDIAWDGLRPIRGLDLFKPEGAMFFFIGVSSLFGRIGSFGRLDNSTDVVEYLLDSQHVVLVPGSAFGDDACMRMSFACSKEDLREGIRRIRLGIEALR